MATPNYSYEKRQKELAKKRKKEDKLKRKGEGKPEEGADDAVQTDQAPSQDDQPGLPPASSAA
ncbi:MAG: hypothetical protein M3R45_10075 [Pseudomonadota bacterium]|nr:hypothetical protein [Pseudomonadota bacterium]